MPLDSEKLYDQVDYLRVINQEQMIDRSRIRDIMNGGEAAVKALLGNSVNVEYHELPAPNLFLTALERFAQKLGRSPDLKVDIIKRWWKEYNCSHWVIEENGFQKAIRQDVSIKDFANRHGVFLEGHETRNQKFDPLFGVTAMRPMFADKIINLPYSGFEAQEKINLFTSQLVYFSSARNKSKSVGTKTDIVMASWFPMRAIRRMQKEKFAELGYEYNPSFTGYNSSNMDLDNWS